MRLMGQGLSFALAFLVIAPLVRADDAEAIAALRAKIEQQAAQVESLRAELARLEASIQGRQAASPVPAPAVPTPAPAPAPAPPPAPTIKFGGLLQGWYVGGDAGFNDTFRIRRSELRVSGELAKKFGWSVMIDPSKALTLTSGAVNQPSRALQDAYITVAGPHASTLVVGQYRIPLSREGLEPAGALDTVERALFLSDRARSGNYGDIRDIGVSLRGTLGGRYDYNFGVFNSSGEFQNDVDRDDRKALVGRFVARVTNDLRVGGSGAWGGPAEVGRPRRDRLGGEVLYTHGPVKLAAELMTGTDGVFDRRGYYLHAGYRFRPRLEGIARVDGWDPDRSRLGGRDADETDYTVGFNWSVVSTLRMQGNVVHKMFSDDALDDRNLLLINLQTSW
jgi:phosphate-selective porin O/P